MFENNKGFLHKVCKVVGGTLPPTIQYIKPVVSPNKGIELKLLTTGFHDCEIICYNSQTELEDYVLHKIIEDKDVLYFDLNTLNVENLSKIDDSYTKYVFSAINNVAYNFTSHNVSYYIGSKFMFMPSCLELESFYHKSIDICACGCDEHDFGAVVWNDPLNKIAKFKMINPNYFIRIYY